MLDSSFFFFFFTFSDVSLPFFGLHYIALYHTTLHYMNYITLYTFFVIATPQYSMIHYDMISYTMISYNMI